MSEAKPTYRDVLDQRKYMRRIGMALSYRTVMKKAAGQEDSVVEKVRDIINPRRVKQRERRRRRGL